ncbi:DUF4230 domain-containing protein [Planctomycetota bacterium]
MQEIAIGIMVGLIGAVVVFMVFRFRRKHNLPTKPSIYTSIEDLRSVGELVVFKIVTKEIVTTAEHWFGEFGKKYFLWLASTKKMAMIFEFEISFRYNLQSSEFVIEAENEGHYRLIMPKCLYETSIRDISFYDEQNAKLLPWLLPDLVNRAFGPGFNEADKNRLMEEAKQQAVQMAKEFTEKMQSEVQKSATQTLEAIGKAFGAEVVTLDFSEAQLVQTKIDSVA